MLYEPFWSGRRVLVTGHAGFKGTWLCAWLTALGAEVTGVGLTGKEGPSLLDATGLSTRMQTYEVDVRDGELVHRIAEAAAPEIVFHLAGQALLLEGVRDPLATLSANIMGTAHLLEMVRHTPSVHGVVVVTSDKCYRDPTQACDEDAPLGGLEPYGASKACAEIVTAAYRRTYLAQAGVGVATARAGNVIGGGDMAADRLVPDLVRAWQAGRPAVLRQAGGIRPWQHVLDALSGYLLLAQRLIQDPGRFAGPWNFGPDADEVVTVSEIAAEFHKAIGGGRALHAIEPARHDAPILRLSSARARRRLGWVPQLTAAEAVRWAAEGYRRLLQDGEGGWIEEQIERYTARLAAPEQPRGKREVGYAHA
jgi:CDP-glucose 4,6-dehydratase